MECLSLPTLYPLPSPPLSLPLPAPILDSGEQTDKNQKNILSSFFSIMHKCRKNGTPTPSEQVLVSGIWNSKLGKIFGDISGKKFGELIFTEVETSLTRERSI